VRSFHLVEVTYGKGKRELCTEGFGVGLIAAMIKRRAKGKKAYGADGIRRGRRAFAALVTGRGKEYACATSSSVNEANLGSGTFKFRGA
jgi:hypothetical protein